MTDRKVISIEKLCEIINDKLKGNSSTKNVEIVGKIRKREEPYEDGGNWNRSVAIGGTPSDPQKCGEDAADMIEALAEGYNVE